MKKILIAQDINTILQRTNSFLQRADMRILTAATSDEALATHSSEHLDLIITRLDMPGMTCERFFSIVREDPELRNVAIIMICPNNKDARTLSLRLGAHAAYRQPIKPALVLAKAQKLLNLSPRETYRVLLNVAVDGKASNAMFSCSMLDINMSGLQMETTLDFHGNDRLFCSFYLPDADTTHITVMGKIVRTCPPAPGSDANRYGLHFLDLTADAQQALHAFLRKGSLQHR